MADNRFKIKNGLLVEAGPSEITGSLTVTSITGSLSGTASFSISASYALAVSGTIENAVSASYALTASVATTASYSLTASLATTSSYAFTASYLNPVTSGYVVLTQVSQSLDYVDDTAAAAGGVPLGGLYRNGNFILIRIT